MAMIMDSITGIQRRIVGRKSTDIYVQRIAFYPADGGNIFLRNVSVLSHEIELFKMADLGAPICLLIRTAVTAVVQQDHFLDQIGRRPVQHAATKKNCRMTTVFWDGTSCCCHLVNCYRGFRTTNPERRHVPTVTAMITCPSAFSLRPLLTLIPEADSRQAVH